MAYPDASATLYVPAMAVGEPEQVPAAGARPAEISIVVPTYNEADNLEELIRRIACALGTSAWEVIVVDDDSPDGTAARARHLYARDSRVRTLRRVGRRGLSSACIEGMLSSSAPYLAVIDADLQHDPALLARMLGMLRRGDTDVVIASRYMQGASIGAWAERRAAISRIATRVSNRFLKTPLSDPMSGYFALRREIVDSAAPRLSGLGFKILLDLLLTAGPVLRVRELPYTFGIRIRGESKLTASVAWECALLLLDKSVGRYLPARFLAFAAIGTAGLGVHFAALSLLHLALHLPFVAAQAVATMIAIVFNFSVNNLLTYSDRSLSGKAWFGGLLSFATVCGFGALANVGVAGYLFDHHARWPLAALAGIAASAVWNFSVSARYTWRTDRTTK